MNADRNTPYGTKVIVKAKRKTRLDGPPEEIRCRGYFLGACMGAPDSYCAIQIHSVEKPHVWWDELPELDVWVYDTVFIEDWEE